METTDLLDESASGRRKRNLPEANNIMWMGIISIIIIGGLIGLILAIITIVKANGKINEYKKHPHIYHEKGFLRVRAGKICAISGLLLRVVLIIILVAIVNS